MNMKYATDFPIKFNNNDVEIIEKKTLYQGFFSLKEYYFRHRLFNGGMSDIVKREVFERGNAIALLAYDVKRDCVVMVEQIRVGAMGDKKSPWLLEMIAGIIDENESIEKTTRREAQEEAGIHIGRCKRVLSYLASPGGMTERLDIMVGETDASMAGGIHGLAEENEDILVHVVKREIAYQWVEEGLIYNAASIIALQWLQLNYKQLQNEWNA